MTAPFPPTFPIGTRVQFTGTLPDYHVFSGGKVIIKSPRPIHGAVAPHPASPPSLKNGRPIFMVVIDDTGCGPIEAFVDEWKEIPP